MRFKRLLSLLLVISLAATVALTGCGTTTGDGGGNVTPAPPADNKTTDSGTDSGASGGTDSGAKTVSHDKQLTIDIYDVAANYQGLQTGWFDKVVKDRFNLALNILAPQVAGDALYQTRLSSGNLGDIVLLEPTQFADCMQNGVIKDITADIGNYKNLMDYKTQIDVYNKGLPGNTAGKIYGIPVQMTNTSPTAYSQDVIYSSPQLRWDLYQKIGAPEIKDLNGLLDALAEIQKVHPKNDDGDPAYAMTLWPDWDGGDNMLGIANVVQLTTWYGEKIKGQSFLIPKYILQIADKTGTYYKCPTSCLNAQNKALWILTPRIRMERSISENLQGRTPPLVHWKGGFGTHRRLADGTAFIFIPVMDRLLSDPTHTTEADCYRYRFRC
jgi:multiple sugar transport system substrate-binding protein/putative aldouronate transport system substrate-binding protein